MTEFKLEDVLVGAGCVVDNVTAEVAWVVEEVVELLSDVITSPLRSFELAKNCDQ